MTTHSGFWQGNRKQVPILVGMASLITLNIGPTASAGIRAVEVGLILWCVAFAGWFWRQPARAMEAATAVGDVQIAAPVAAATASTIEKPAAPAARATRDADADPLGQACRRFGLPVDRVVAADEVTHQQ